MSMMLLGGEQRRPNVTRALQAWTAAQPLWHLRPEGTANGSLPSYRRPAETYRLATVDEVAASLVSDPAVREALTALNSPMGQLAEQMVAQTLMPDWQAKLLVEALNAATKIILDENRPAWQRGEVLVGVFAALVFIALLVRTTNE